MASGNDVAETLLRYRVDTASVSAAVAANQKVAASTVAVAQSAAAAGGALRFDTAAQAAAALGISVERLGVAEKAVTLEKQQQLTLARQLSVEQQAQAAFVGRSAGGRSFGAGVQRASRGLFNLPDVQLTPGISTTVVSRIGQVAGAGLDTLGVSAAQFGAAAAVAAPLVLGLVAVTSAYGKAAEQSTERAKSFTEAFKQALTAGTTAQIQELIKRQQLEIEIAERTREVLQERQSGAPEQLALVLENTTTDLADRLNQAARDVGLSPQGGDFRDTPLPGDSAISRESYNALIDEQTKAINLGGAALEAYNLVLGEQIVATGDLTVAQQDMAEAQVEAAQLVLEVDRLTTEQREERARRAERDIELLQREIDTGNAQGLAVEELEAQMIELNGQYLELTTATTTYADVLEAERINKEALTDQTDQLLELVDQEVAAREKLFEINQRIADIEAERIADIERITQERDERLLEIGEDNAEARIKIEEDTADRIAKINRDAKRATEIATAERDVVAFTLAKIRQKDALEDEGKSYDKRLKELEKSLDKQLKAIEKGYQKQIDNVNISTQRQLEIQYRAQQQQLHIIETSLTSQRFLTEQGMAGMVVATANGFITMQEIVVTSLTNMVGAIRGIFGSGGSQFPPLVGGGRGGGAGGGGGALIDRNTANMYQAFRNLKQRTA